MKLNNTLKISALAVLTLTASSQAAEKMIYDEDDRADYYAMPNNLRWAADSTVSLWKKENVLLDNEAGVYNLTNYIIGEKYNLCPEAKFRDQPVGSFCSGALVGEDLILTAGHCITSEDDCSAASFVFGYAVKAVGEPAVTKIPADEVYTCSRIIKRQHQKDVTTVDNAEVAKYGPDYALIKLDRKVKDHTPLPVNRNGGLNKDTQLFMTSHPLGMPVKFVGNARVIREIDNGAAYFMTNLDTFGGSSGSPVFNAKTMLIEGVHVRGIEGEKHFVQAPSGCLDYKVKPTSTAYGGSVTKVDFLVNDIPATSGELSAQSYVRSSLEKLRMQEYGWNETVNFDF